MNKCTTIARQLEGRRNNFGPIRLIAASLVVFSHSFPLTGHIDSEPLARLVHIIDFSSVAVITFFVVSGLLVAKSASTSTAGEFARARFLRIWPGLLLTACVTAFGLGLMVTTLPAGQYLTNAETWRYVIGIPLLDVGRPLPGVFSDNPIPKGVNGSLWTIQIEAWLYLIMGGLVALKVAKSRSALNAFLICVLVAYYFFPAPILEWIPRHDAYMTTRLIGSFMFGMAFFTNARYIPLSWVVAIALFAVTYLSIGTRYFDPVFYAAFAYAVVCMALHPSSYVSKWNNDIDLSYGIYIFAFPIQQTVVSVFGPMNPYLCFAICFPIIVATAFASWTFVESKALRLKHKRLPGRAP